jgi:hypothetical protein|tara:strand:- start:181 stop:414 length:234 start_codon:yes stop_codon:yes gene_type:complete
MLKVKKGSLIQFTNLVNECCELIDDSMVEEFLTTPHGYFNNTSPLEEFNEHGTTKILRLLYFIDIGEADIFDKKTID